MKKKNSSFSPQLDTRAHFQSLPPLIALPVLYRGRVLIFFFLHVSAQACAVFTGLCVTRRLKIGQCGLHNVKKKIYIYPKGPNAMYRRGRFLRLFVLNVVMPQCCFCSGRGIMDATYRRAYMRLLTS